MNSDKVFKKAPFNIVAWIWTLTYLLGFIFFATRSLIIVLNGSFPDVVDTFFTLALLIVVVMAYLRSVRYYAIEGDQLVIVRSGPGRINIPLEHVVGAVADPAIGSFFNVTFLSTGGVFGWAGKARVRNPSDLKSLDAEVYGTNPKYALMMELRSGRIVIVTPVDAKGLETELRIAGAGETIRDTRPSANKVIADRANRADRPKPWLQGNKK